MTVQGLIDALQKIENKDVNVVLSSDAEGNSFRYLDEVEDTFLRFDSASSELTEDPTFPECVVLFPED